MAAFTYGGHLFWEHVLCQNQYGIILIAAKAEYAKLK
jgi:hypothetical protein